MYRLLIVEDEEIFRNVLPLIVDWNSIGFEVAGIVENGHKALEILEKVQPDVILTDIRMPVLNGLELAMEVKTRYPGIKVVLLSAFNEFDYARKGIDCGVYGYILKSDGEDEIEDYFAKLKKVLDEENLRNMAGDEMWRQREVLLKSILEDRTGSGEANLEKARKLGITPYTSGLRIALFQLDEYKYISFRSGVNRAQSINRLIRSYLYKNVEIQNMGIVIGMDDMVCVLWSIPEKAYLQNAVEVFDGLKEELGMLDRNDDEYITVSCAAGSKVLNLQELPGVYHDAREALFYRTHTNGNCIINFDSLPCNSSGVLTFTEETRLLKEIMPVIHGGSTEKILDYLGKLENSFIAAKYTDINIISGFASRLILAIIGDMGKMGVKSDAFFTKSNYIVKELGYCGTTGLVFRKLEGFIIEAFVLLNGENNVQSRKIVDEAVSYIRKNYATQLSLDKTAKHVNVHPVHLSRLFSKDLGETFKRVLMETRIEEAKRLLKDINYRVYEISSLVGYEKPRYFSELFRSMTGLTPLEYREKFKE